MPRPPSATPFLSVILCTHNGADRLRKTFESLVRQTLGRDAFEIVLIDDGSSDGTRELVRAFEPELPLRYSRQRHAGLASARNHGIFLARGAIVLFLEEGDVAHPGLLAAHRDAHRSFPDPCHAVVGQSELDPALASDPLMRYVTEIGGFLFTHPQAQDGEILDFHSFRGARPSCKRAFLVQRGVFNPLFRHGCGDIELAYRLSRRGFEIAYEPGARSRMAQRIGYDDFCTRLYLEGRSSFVLSLLHKGAAIRQWTEVAGAPALWGRIGPRYQAILRAGRERDRIVRLRLAMGMRVGESDIELLHRDYWAAFRASRVKGIVDEMAERGEDLVPGPTRPAAGRVEKRGERRALFRRWLRGPVQGGP